VRVKGYGVTVPHLSSVPADLLAFFSQTHKEVVVTISPTATPHSEEVATVAAIVSVARVRVEGDEDTDIVVSIRLQRVEGQKQQISYQTSGGLHS
jgi:hypothetical protein